MGWIRGMRAEMNTCVGPEGTEILLKLHSRVWKEEKINGKLVKLYQFSKKKPKDVSVIPKSAHAANKHSYS